MANSPRILISGYYGAGNAGDEAILAALVGTIRRLRPEAELIVLSANPQATAQTYAVEAVPRFSRAALHREIAQHKSQLLISGGGGLIQDTTSWRSPLYYLALLWQAKRKGLKTVALLQGIGPLRRPWLRKLTARVFRRLDLIAVRDQPSAQLLVDWGVPASAIEVAADAVWLLDPTEPPSDSAQVDTARPAVGVFLRPLPNQPAALSADLWQAIAGGLEGFIRGHGGSVIFVPMQQPGDEQASQEVMARFKGPASLLSGNWSPGELLALAGSFDLVLGMRLHSLLFAARMGVPPVGISYDPKVDALLAQVGLGAATSAEQPDAGALAEALRDTWEKRAEIKPRLDSVSAENRQKALHAVEEALALLE